MYKILKILEEDYGCEGIPENEEFSCRVLLEDQNQKQFWKKIPDAYLTKYHLEEGSVTELPEF